MMAENNEIDLRRFFRALRSHRWLFCACFATVVALATVFALTRPKRYTTSATLLIEDSSNDLQQRAGGAMAMMLRSFSIGGFGNASIDNEMVLMESHDVLDKTVRQLGLNVDCRERHGLTKQTLWDDNPIALSIPTELSDTLPNRKQLRIKVRLHDGKADVAVSDGGFFGSTVADEKGLTLPATVTTRYGVITLSPTEAYSKSADRSLSFTVTSYDKATDLLERKITIDTYDKASDGITLELDSDCPAKARATLNTVMANYNLKRVDRKHQTAAEEVDFINRRIESLFEELLSSEKKMEEFKTASKFVSIEDEAPIILESSLEGHKDMLDAQAEIIYCEHVLNAIKESPEAMLPAYASPGSQQEANPMVVAYNEQLMMLNELKRSAKPGNNALKLAEERTEQMRQSVIESLSQTLTVARKAIGQRAGVLGQMDSHLKKLPKYERDYINLKRDNLINNELYAFLVEKRESSLLKYYSNSELGFVIDPAYTAVKPNLIRPVLIIILGVVAGAALCVLIALLMMRRDRTVRGPIDLAATGLEKQSVVFGNGDSREAADRLRAMISSGANFGKPVFIATIGADSCDDAIDSLHASLMRAEIPTVRLDGNGSDDTLLSPAFRKRAQDAAGSGSIPFVRIADGDMVASIRPVIESLDATTVLFVKAGTVSRESLAGTAAQLDSLRVIIAIVD